MSVTSHTGTSLSKESSSDSLRTPRSDSKSPRSSGKFDPLRPKEKEGRYDLKGSNEKKRLSVGELPENDLKRSSERGKDKKRLSGEVKDKKLQSGDHKKRPSTDGKSVKFDLDKFGKPPLLLPVLFRRVVLLYLSSRLLCLLENANIVTLERYRTDESDALPPPFVLEIPATLPELMREGHSLFFSLISSSFSEPSPRSESALWNTSDKDSQR